MSYNKAKQFQLLKTMGKSGLLADHYELADKHPAYTSDDWRQLLQDPEVSLFISQEFKMIRDAEVRKLQAMASDSNRSVGAAQMINSMVAVAEKAETKKEGPVFIYTFVPPNPEQLKAPNVRIVDYAEAQEKGLQPKEIPITLTGKKIENPEGDPRWTEKK